MSNDKTLLLLGARSDIGLAIAYKFAKEGFDVQLAARNSSSLNDECSDLIIRYGIKVSLHEFDVLDTKTYFKFIESLPTLPSIVVSAIGYLGIEDDCELKINNKIKILRTNFEGVVTLFCVLSDYFKQRGSGTLVGISSVAGDRGRGSNYIYGSAKAGFSAFLSGLRNKLYPYGIHVITVKPGYVYTKMTSHLNLPKLLTSNPLTVANYIYKAYKFKKNIVYVNPIWRYIMTAIRIIPESIFKKIKL